MRKRNKAARGSRALSSRAGRGSKSRSMSNKNMTAVEDSSLTTNSRPTPTTRGKRGRNQSVGNGVLLKNLNSTGDGGGGFQSNGKSLLGTVAVPNLSESGDSKTISPDFYLHKKFKKLTTTTCKSLNVNSVNDNNKSSSSGVSDVASKDSFKSDKQQLLLPRSRLNDSTSSSSSSASTLVSSSSSLSKDSSLSTVMTLNSSKGLPPNVMNAVSVKQAYCASNSSQSNHDHVSTSSPSSSCSSIKFQSSFDSTDSTMTNTSAAISSSTTSDNVASSSTVVYKPKFRIAADNFSSPDDLSVGGTPTLDSSSLSGGGSTPSSTLEDKVVIPAKINGEFHMDRQSLDDRISKIIDENQSILSTWPEHLTKRLKSHVQRHQQNQQQQQQQTISNTTKRMLIVGGGGSMEVPNYIPASGGGSSVKMRNLEVSPPVPIPAPILLRSQSDAGGHYMTDSMTRSQSYNFVPVDSSCSSSSSSTNLTNNGSSSSSFQNINGLSNPTSANTVVPKKRRRLSATPVRLCGGEVSEVHSSHEAPLVKGNKGYFQDVDIQIKGGTSGAKVTIRTSSFNESSSSGSNVISYNRLMDVPAPININCPPNHLFIRASSNHLTTTNFHEKSLPEKDVLTSNSILSLNEGKVTNNCKPRGRPPKKGRIAIVEPLQMESTLVPLSPGPDTCSPKLSVIVSPSNGLQKSILETPFKIMTTLPLSLSSIMNKIEPSSIPLGEDSVKTEIIQDDDEVSPKPLVLQSSSLNHKRPTFLALKPINPSKKSEHGILPSPETPRGAKPYNQMHINGHAYTYLGFKVSTRSSYTCLFRPQPMFLPQESDPKLSMYSNWQPRPRHKNQQDIGISTNDSRVNGRKSPGPCFYTSAGREKCDTQTVNSPDNQTSLWSLLDASYISPSTTPDNSTSLDISNYPFTVSSEFTESKVGIKTTTLSTATTATTTLTSSSSSSRPLSSPCASNSSKLDLAENGKCRETFNSKMRNSCTKNMEIINVTNSSSDSSSADESSNSFSHRFSREHTGNNASSYHDDETNRTQNDQELALSNSNDEEVIMSRFDNPSNRLRIMEGGFESNEDYTYVRGRGRGRYVCEACGIRCKKPSMLRKHLKTHSNLRPYTCKLCNFSFKTKGNLTKHQKSKSHHKKCIGLGIHPNSSRSLAMIGPRFCTSDTNTDDSEDEEDNGVYNGDSDSNPSQEDMDTEELSSSAEPEQQHSLATVKGKAHSFEQEIAQSLLDLSKVSRMPIENGESMAKTSKTLSEEYLPPKEASLVQIVNNYNPNSKPNGFSSCTSNFVQEDSSSSSSHQNLSTVNSNANSIVAVAVDGPIDLSCRNKPISVLPIGIVDSETDMKRMRLEKNGYARSFGIVGEAQRWEPEGGEFMITGCLNLKKIPNESSGTDIVTASPAPPPQLVNGTPNHSGVTVTVTQPTPTPMVDIKPEIRSFNFSNNNIGEKPYEFIVPKRRRDSSTSSCGESYTSVLAPVQLKLSPSRSSSTLNNNNLSTVAPPSQAPSSHNQSQKQQKLHQPWLSPRDSSFSVDDSIKSQQQQQSSTTIEPPTKSPSLNNGAFTVRESKNKIGDSSLVVSEGTSEPSTLSSVLIDHQRSVQTSSPNTKPFANLATVNFRQPSGAQLLVKDEGKAECTVCNKSFARASQLTLHMNIHYLERPFRCNPCGVSFRTKGHLIKHRRSSSHDSKVKVTYYVANEENPRPFKCPECKIAFRIHGHLAKHLRSKMHIMRMECLGKLPFGIFFEMEKSGLNLAEIDTTDCEVSLISLQGVAKKIYGDSWTERLCVPVCAD